MMDGWSIVIGILGALATVGSTIIVFVKSRGENKTAERNAKAALDARIDARVTEQLKDAWARQDSQDAKIGEQDNKIRELSEEMKSQQLRETRRTGAMTRILKAIAAQWPADAHGPNLDPNDISEIEETIPTAWIRKHIKTD